MNKYKRSEDIRNVEFQEYRANPNASIEEVARTTSLSRDDGRVKVSFKKKSNISGLNKIGFFISSLFLIWSIFAFNDLFWNFGSDWVGYIWLSVGLLLLFSQIISVMNKYKRSEDIRNVVLQEYRANPNASIEEVARITGLNRNSVREILLDLKMRGFLILPFNTTIFQPDNVNFATYTFFDKIKFIMQRRQVQVSQEDRIIYSEKTKICSNCGTKNNRDATNYCEFCGSAL